MTRQKETFYETQHGHFGSEVAVGFLYGVFSLSAGPPGNEDKPLTKSRTGTSGPKLPLDLCMAYSLSRPGNRAMETKPLQTNGTGTLDQKVPLDLCMTCALFLGGATRRQKETVYEKQNGDFGSEVAVGFVYG